jgi:hypothetical protein
MMTLDVALLMDLLSSPYRLCSLCELNVQPAFGCLLVLTLEIIAHILMTLHTLVFFSHKTLKRKSDIGIVQNYMTKEM